MAATAPLAVVGLSLNGGSLGIATFTEFGDVRHIATSINPDIEDVVAQWLSPARFELVVCEGQEHLAGEQDAVLDGIVGLLHCKAISIDTRRLRLFAARDSQATVAQRVTAIHSEFGLETKFPACDAVAAAWIAGCLVGYVRPAIARQSRIIEEYGREVFGPQKCPY